MPRVLFPPFLLFARGTAELANDRCVPVLTLKPERSPLIYRSTGPDRKASGAQIDETRGGNHVGQHRSITPERDRNALHKRVAPRCVLSWVPNDVILALKLDTKRSKLKFRRESGSPEPLYAPVADAVHQQRAGRSDSGPARGYA